MWPIPMVLITCEGASSPTTLGTIGLAWEPLSSSNSTFDDSSIHPMDLLRTRYAWEFESYPTNIPSYVLASNLANRVFLFRMKHLQPNTRKYLTFGFFPIRSSYGVLFLNLRRYSLLEA